MQATRASIHRIGERGPLRLTFQTHAEAPDRWPLHTTKQRSRWRTTRSAAMVIPPHSDDPVAPRSRLATHRPPPRAPIKMTELITPYLLTTFVEPAPSPSDPPHALELYRALGVAVVAWGRLEGHFTLITITLLNLGSRKQKKFPMKWEGQVAVWREGLSAVPQLAGLRGPAEQFLSKMGVLAEARHAIVHSNWGLFRRGSPAAIDVMKVRAQPKTEDGLLDGRTFFTAAYLGEFSEGANQLNRELMKISVPIVALRGTPPSAARRL